MTTNDQRDAEIDRLLRDALKPSRRAVSGACPDASVMAAFEEGSISGPERAALEAHFAGCERCQAILASLAETASIAGPRAEAKRPWLRGGHLRWLIPVIAASGFVLYLAVRPVIAPSHVFVSSAPARDAAAAAATNELAASRPAEPLVVAEAGKPPEEATRVDEQKLTAAGPKPAAPEGVAPAKGAAEQAARQERTIASRTAAERTIAPPVSVDRLDAERRQAANAAVPAAARPQPAAPPPPAAGAAGAQPTAPPPQPAAQTAAAADTVAVKPLPQAAPEQGQARAATVAAPAVSSGREAELARGAGAAGILAGAAVRKTALKEPSLPIVVASPGADTLWRLEADGGISRSTDGGRSWKRQLPAGPGRWLTASAPSRDVCWAAGRDGLVMLTVDGVAWQSRSPGPRVDIVAIEAIDQRSATLATSDGRRFSTTDGGATWFPDMNIARLFRRQ